MHISTNFLLALATLTGTTFGHVLPRAQRATVVTGSPEGFAKGTTGGAGGKTVAPNSNADLVNYLTSSDALTIVLTKTFDFTGTEGSTTETGCAPFGTAAGCQLAINANDWCKNNPKVSVTYDKAAIHPINMGSNKSLVGSGSSGIIKGKGLRIANGASNIIIQNVAITDLNPKYVWGGDAITLDGSNKVWIDHVTTARIGRQHIVSGYNTNTAVTISNSEIDGYSQWSATCDNHHYWALYFTGQNDQITLKGNYIHNTSGRSPKLEDDVVVHAVNNYWYANSGHAFEGGSSYVVVEGSVFQDVKQPLDSKWSGSMFASTSTTSACQNALGRSCQANIFGSSGALSEGDAAALSKLSGKTIASAAAATSAQKSVPSNAGQGNM